MDKDVCGNCEWHKPEAKDEFVCTNSQSENYGLETAYDDSCEDHERRE